MEQQRPGTRLIVTDRYAAAPRPRSFQSKPGHAFLKNIDLELVNAGAAWCIHDQANLNSFTGTKIVGQRTTPVVVDDDLACLIKPVISEAHLKRRADTLAREPEGIARVL